MVMAVGLPTNVGPCGAPLRCELDMLGRGMESLDEGIWTMTGRWTEPSRSGDGALALLLLLKRW